MKLVISISTTCLMMTSSNVTYVSALLALCAGNSPVPVNSPHKGQWRGSLMFSLICVWINDWVNNREAGDLRRHYGHYDVNVMSEIDSLLYIIYQGHPLSCIVYAKLKPVPTVCEGDRFHSKRNQVRGSTRIALFCIAYVFVLEMYKLAE